MGLAVPTAVMVASGRGAAAGVLIKGGEPLERLAAVDTVIFDKTGTLTEGRPRVERVVCADGIDEEAALRWIGAVERRSEHPLAAAIADFTGAAATDSDVSGFEALAGKGVRARVGGVPVLIGTDALVSAEGIDTASLRETLDEWAEDGQTPVIAASNGAVVIASAAMAFSSVSVVANSLRLRRVRLS